MRYILINRPEKKTDRGKRNDNEPVARDDEAADIVKCNRLQKERVRERERKRERERESEIHWYFFVKHWM